MKALATLALSAALAVAAPNPKAEGEVRAAMEAFKKAVMSADKAALDKLTTADLSYTHSNGRVETKAEFIAAATSGKTKVEAMDISDATVRVHGNAAMLQAKILIKNNAAGVVTPVSLNILHVWIKGSGGWQLAARQAIRLSPPVS